MKTLQYMPSALVACLVLAAPQTEDHEHMSISMSHGVSHSSMAPSMSSGGKHMSMAMAGNGDGMNMNMSMDMTPAPIKHIPTEWNTERTLMVGMIIFQGYEPLDVWGPLQLLDFLSSRYKISLSVIGHKIGLVGTQNPPHSMEGMGFMEFSYTLNPKMQTTHTFADAPPVDVLIVPGGMGNLAMHQNGDTAVEDFVATRFDRTEYVLSVCTGALSLAKAGVLKGRRATTNKAAWKTVTQFGENIIWVPTARWVEDGKVWTSSGVAAAIDMMYAFLKHLYGTDYIDTMMDDIEYLPHTDPHWDPFSVVHNVPGANMTGPMANCVTPVGQGGGTSK